MEKQKIIRSFNLRWDFPILFEKFEFDKIFQKKCIWKKYYLEWYSMAIFHQD